MHLARVERSESESPAPSCLKLGHISCACYFLKRFRRVYILTLAKQSMASGSSRGSLKPFGCSHFDHEKQIVPTTALLIDEQMETLPHAESCQADCASDRTIPHSMRGKR